MCACYCLDCAPVEMPTTEIHLVEDGEYLMQWRGFV